MIIHYHHAFVPNSGYLKRMKNIDRDLVSLLNEKSVEIEFYPRSKRKFVKTEGQFILSPNVVKKYYVELPRYGILVVLKRIIVFAWLLLKYRPTFVIGEAQMLPGLLGFFRFLAPNAKYIFDCHGAVAAEAEYSKRSDADILTLKSTERDSVQKVDYVVCQSPEMKSFINREYGVNEKNICVYRCGVDTSQFMINENREAIRKILGVADNELLFVYSGGIDLWQRVGDCLDFFLDYHKSQPYSKFLVLTMDKDRLVQMMKERNVESDGAVIVKCLHFRDVPDYLNACDVAFLLRDNHIMNAVASPTKLAEYMACGLPVITSKVARSWIDKEGEKYCIFEEELTVDTILDSVRRIDRKKVSEYASKVLSLDADISCMKHFIAENNLIPTSSLLF